MCRNRSSGRQTVDQIIIQFYSWIFFSRVFSTSTLVCTIFCRGFHTSRMGLPSSEPRFSYFITRQQVSLSQLPSIISFRYYYSRRTWRSCRKDRQLRRLPGGIFFSRDISILGVSLFSRASMICSPCLRSSQRVLASFCSSFSLAQSSIMTFSICFSSMSAAIVCSLLCFHTRSPSSSPPATKKSPALLTTSDRTSMVLSSKSMISWYVSMSQNLMCPSRLPESRQCVSWTNLTVVTAYWCANSDFIDCPKSMSQMRMSLSMLPVASRASSLLRSNAKTGILWPYSLRKFLWVSEQLTSSCEFCKFTMYLSVLCLQAASMILSSNLRLSTCFILMFLFLSQPTWQTPSSLPRHSRHRLPFTQHPLHFSSSVCICSFLARSQMLTLSLPTTIRQPLLNNWHHSALSGIVNSFCREAEVYTCRAVGLRWVRKGYCRLS